jgi:hypothetical protein
MKIIGVAVPVAPPIRMAPEVHFVNDNVLLCHDGCSISKHTVCTELFQMASIIIHQEFCICKSNSSLIKEV